MVHPTVRLREARRKIRGFMALGNDCETEARPRYRAPGRERLDVRNSLRTIK